MRNVTLVAKAVRDMRHGLAVPRTKKGGRVGQHGPLNRTENAQAIVPEVCRARKPADNMSKASSSNLASLPTTIRRIKAQSHNSLPVTNSISNRINGTAAKGLIRVGIAVPHSCPVVPQQLARLREEQEVHRGVCTKRKSCGFLCTRKK